MAADRSTVRLAVLRGRLAQLSRGRVPDDVLRAIGETIVRQTRKRFRTQSFGDRAWPPRRTPNVAGAVADLNAGGFPKRRRLAARPALVDTGTLRRAWSWRRVDARTVEVGTNLPYARIHQQGGESEVELTDVGRAQLVKFLRRERRRTRRRRSRGGGGAADVWSKALGWLFSRPRFTVRVPARPMLGLTKPDLDELKRVFMRRLTRT